MQYDVDNIITIHWIKKCVLASEYLISKHAEDERKNDNLSLSDIESVLLNGDTIEHYSDTGRGPSCLVCGTVNHKPIHVVCGKNKHSWLIIITVYRPAWPKWNAPNRKEPVMEPYGDCIYCGGEVIERVQRVDYRLHGQLYILEGVPAGVCQQCGELFFTAEVARRMESVVAEATGPVETLPIPVIAVK
ncbi:MAG: DUF4258 domain-containing protein [Candidatus Hydrogenedentes bacterium]|jgi:YgiT-type zinc finger domain-containing protein|nr:DUF4258 domain-containing protein [Candidatus Hydrogenedentota bacterium]